MANSIVETENLFGSNFASFDDASSDLSSDREDFLLVLVSSLRESTAQGRNQKRALTIIEACGVQPEVLDAADPANALVRDELCEMSGIKGVYPQFFLVQGDRTSFFADFAEVEHMNEEGTLQEWLSMELPITKQSSKHSRTNFNDKYAINDEQSHISQSNSTQVGINAAPWGVESDHEYAPSSTTEDLLNMASVSKILDSFDTNSNVLDEESQQQEQKDGNRSKIENENRNMILTIPTTTSVGKDEWSDPTLLEKYEGEIQALEDYLQDGDEKGGQDQDSPRAENRPAKKEEKQMKSPKKSPRGNVKSTAQIFETKKPQFPASSRKTADNNGDKNKNKNEAKDGNDGHEQRHEGKRNSLSSLVSTATTATITPTSSRSRSPERSRSYQKSAVDLIPVTLPSPQKNIKEISCMDTVSTRSETEQLLQEKVEELRMKCEKLTAERYIIEGQLKEARQRNQANEQRSSNNNVGTIHKFHLLQATRCASCSRTFKANPSSPNAPISSQACGHSICRNCCHKRLSQARRTPRNENAMNSSERLRNTISSDLFMCGMGDMSQVYSPSFEEHQRQECESCPICCTPRAFRPGKLNINEGLCTVLKLLDD